ncbi:MAG: (4Fe-4S)-binding protein [Planctomycetes bacterium RBG_13_63_9]|nr:MAG: (4Fe-4S)-binding protein [Planctomycetes bacterium RBG_13_63_9]
MQIAIASGKGGTGKTTVATNLAWIASRSGWSTAYLDCDVEEPNGHIFLKPEIADRRAVGSLVPLVDVEKCTLCGECGEICQYSAIVRVGEKVLVYPELCHGCGGCSLVCPADAITEVSRDIGVLETGRAGSVQFVQGLLNVGEAMSPPLIKAVKSTALQVDLTIIDAPPGTSCPVIEAVRGVDFVVLVTEPTPFGFHDLKLAVEMVRALKLPCGVVINRAGLDGSDMRSYCSTQRIPILREMPDDRELAEAYSRGEMACEALPKYESMFAGLLETISIVARFD